MDTDPGIALMLRVREGDQAAFGLMYSRFQRQVHRFFYGLCGDPGTCKDLTQETFLRIWKYRARYAAIRSGSSATAPTTATNCANVWPATRSN